MNCYQCRRPAAEGQVFCNRCGARLIPDRAMLDAAAAGDSAATADLYQMAYDAVYYTVHAMVKDEDTVLDLVQDSFLRAFANLDRLQDPARFRPWMKTIARNMAIDEMRSKKPLLFSQMVDEDSDEPLDFEDDRTESLPEEVVDRKETGRLVREILDTLPEDQRMVIALFYYEELSVRQIAQKLGLNENTVKSRLSLGRKKIETKVRSLERQGTRLYSLTPMGFFLALLRQQSGLAPELSSRLLLENVVQQSAENAARTAKAADATASSAGSRAARTAARSATRRTVSTASRSAAARTVTASAGRSAASKIIAAVTAVAVLGGGGAVAVHELQKHREEEPSPLVDTVLPEDGGSSQSSAAIGDERVGLWESEDGTVLWIQSVEDDSLTFSLYVPGRGSINNAEARHLDGEHVFRYEDPFHAGSWAEGNLSSDPDGTLVLNLSGGNLDLGQTRFRFSARSRQPDYEAQYAPILEAYRDHERSGGGLLNWYGDEEGYVHVGLSGVDHYGYTIWDLDDNGVPELVIGPWYTEEDYAASAWLDPDGYSTNVFVDLYSLEDGVPVYLINSGDRYRYSLTDDGQVYYEGSSGAAYSYVFLYRVEGASLAFSDGVYISGGEDSCYHVKDRIGWEYSDDEPISFEQFQQWLAEHESYGDEHLARIQPLLRPVIPAEPADQPAPGEQSWEMSQVYADIVQMYANLQVAPRSQMESFSYAMPPLWSMIERRYSVYYDDSPFEPYYGLYDLDGNGRPELFIGLRQQDGSVALAEVYSSSDTRAFRIAVAGSRRSLMGDGKLLTEGGEYYPCGEVLRLGADGCTPERLLYYGTGCEDPNVYLFDDSRKPDYYYDAEQGANSAHLAYSGLENGLLAGMRPVEELVSFQRIPPDSSRIYAQTPPEITDYQGMLESYVWLNTAEIGPGTGNGLDEDVVRLAAAYRQNHDSAGIWYAYFDGDCDGEVELYIGYPFGQNEHAVACYHADGGILRIVRPARFTGEELEFDRVPWRAIGGYDSPTMHDD